LTWPIVGFDIFATKLYLYSKKHPGLNADCRHGRRKLGFL